MGRKIEQHSPCSAQIKNTSTRLGFFVLWRWAELVTARPLLRTAAIPPRSPPLPPAFNSLRSSPDKKKKHRMVPFFLWWRWAELNRRADEVRLPLLHYIVCLGFNLYALRLTKHIQAIPNFSSFEVESFKTLTHGYITACAYECGA